MRAPHTAGNRDAERLNLPWMASWLFLAPCMLVPQLWAFFLSWLYRRRDERGNVHPDERRKPDYQI